MAGDWIKMRTDLHTHPKVVRMASALKADRLRVVGALHAVWCLFDIHSADGELAGYTTDALDDLIGWPGFSTALQAVEWIEVSGNSLALPRFYSHNGQSAKRRAQESDRKRDARKTSAPDADKMRTREEKRREEITTGEGKPSPTQRTKADIDLSAWNDKPTPQVFTDWKAMRKAKRAPVSQTVIDQFSTEINKAVASGYTADACLSLCILKGWQGFKFDWLKNEGANNANNQRNTGTNRSDRNTQAHRDYIADLERQAEIEAGRCLADSSEPALGY